MFRYVVPAAVCLFVTGELVFGQQSPPEQSQNRRVAQAAPAASPDTEESMEEPLAGDHWTYEIRDEITGEVKSTVTHVVTEVAGSTISVRSDVVGKGTGGYLTYDRAWNLINNGAWKNTPNNGEGVRLPLTAGKTWSFQANEVNSTQGVTLKRSGTSKVSGRESVTTRAGTFDAFKIQTSYTSRNANDPTKKFDITIQMWYVPAINHWAKRTYTSRSDGHLRENSSIELVEYGRK